MSGCRIGKVTLKNPKLAIIPKCKHSAHTVKYDWGEVTFRLYDGSNITNKTMIYMLRTLEREIIGG